MKKLYSLGAWVFIPAIVSAQVCDFTVVDWPYSVSALSGSFSITNGQPDYPSGSHFGYNQSDALTSSGGEVVVAMEALNSTLNPQSYVSFYVGAYGMSGPGKGMDASTDYVSVEVRTAGQTTWEEKLRIKGYSNALWSMQGELAVSSSQLSTKEYIPESGGELDTICAISKFVLDELPRSDSLFIRFRMMSDRANEIWAIDQIEWHKTVHYTNAAGTGVWNDPQNWSELQVPDSTQAIYWSDTLPSLPNHPFRFARLITEVGSAANLFNSHLTVGEWLHLQGDLTSDTTLCIDASRGSGELMVANGTVRGRLTLKRSFAFKEGWRHWSSRLRTEWKDITDHATTVNYNSGATSSIFAWDATNENWYALGQNNMPTKALPVSIYAGPNWLDSSNVITLSGSLSEADTFTAIYGFPNGNSPFNQLTGNEGWNFIGNPFPYTVSLHEILSDGSFPSEIAPTAYVWNGNMGTYSSYNTSSGTSLGGSPYLKPWQGCWVQFNTNPGNFRTIIVKPEHATYSHQISMYKRGIAKAIISIQNGDEMRQVNLMEQPGAALTWEGDYDQYQRNHRSFEAYLDVNKNSGIPVRVAVKAIDPLCTDPLTLIVEHAGKDYLEFNGSSDWGELWLERVETEEFFDLTKESIVLKGLKESSTKFRVWLKQPLNTTSLGQNDQYILPLYQGNSWVSQDHNTWVLYNMKGERVLELSPGTSVLVNHPDGIFIWKCGELARKVQFVY